MALLCFSMLSQKTQFSKKLENIKRGDFLYSFVWNNFNSKNSSATYHKCTALQVKYLLLLSDRPEFDNFRNIVK